MLPPYFAYRNIGTRSYLSFHQQPLESHYAYIFCDGVDLRVGESGENLALLVVIGVDGEGNKRLLGMIPGDRESYENWLDVFRHLRERGVKMEWVSGSGWYFWRPGSKGIGYIR